jgi:hypothetical protein
MMDDTRLDDAALDVLVSETVRVDAPEGFAIRVGAALDSRESSARPRAWLRPALAVAALLLIAIWWWRQPLPVKPEACERLAPSHPKHLGAPVAPRRTFRHLSHLPHLAHPTHPSHPSHLSHPSQTTSVRWTRWPTWPAVQQEAIDPAAIRARTIDVRPADAITPLTVDTDRPDPGGEGDHR